MSGLDMLWIILCAALVFLMQAGFLCLGKWADTLQEQHQCCHQESC